MKLSSPFMFWRKRRFCLQLEVNGFDCLKSICFCPPYLLVKLNLKKKKVTFKNFIITDRSTLKKKSFLLNCICIPYFPGQCLTYLVNLGTVFWEILTGKPGNKHWHCTLGGFRGSDDINYFQRVEIFSLINCHHLWAKNTNVQKHHFKATNWKNNNIVP